MDFLNGSVGDKSGEILDYKTRSVMTIINFISLQ